MKLVGGKNDLVEEHRGLNSDEVVSIRFHFLFQLYIIRKSVMKMTQNGLKCLVNLGKAIGPDSSKPNLVWNIWADLM